MNKTCYYFFLWMCFILCSCGDESDNTSTDYGNCPDQQDGKSLVLKNDDGTIKLSADHFKSGVTINNVTVDYDKYPPSYSYTIINRDKAQYHLNATKKTYIPYYETYNYGTFIFDIDLTFTSKTSGTYWGHQTNANNVKTTITGTFIIK